MTERGECLALYRLPGAESYTRVVSHRPPLRFPAADSVPASACGYLAAPFRVTPDCPVILIKPDEVAVIPLPSAVPPAPAAVAEDTAGERAEYSRTFAGMKRLLSAGSLAKVVLSRRLRCTLQGAERAEGLFLRACALRPECFVALWDTPATGRWLTATPEPLLLSDGADFWRTVALAGTRPCTDRAGEWDAKNVEEQALVARYVAECLAPIAEEVEETEVRTIRAGNVCHLRTDFRFRLRTDVPPLQAAAALHPTPAVCGLPQKMALEAIACGEPSPRRYYAGFSGPLAMGDATALYMSLRCTEIRAGEATLYAGGGLLPESSEAAEWEETRHKLRTMMQVLGLE